MTGVASLRSLCFSGLGAGGSQPPSLSVHSPSAHHTAAKMFKGQSDTQKQRQQADRGGAAGRRVEDGQANGSDPSAHCSPLASGSSRSLRSARLCLSAGFFSLQPSPSLLPPPRARSAPPAQMRSRSPSSVQEVGHTHRTQRDGRAGGGRQSRTGLIGLFLSSSSFCCCCRCVLCRRYRSASVPSPEAAPSDHAAVAVRHFARDPRSHRRSVALRHPGKGRGTPGVAGRSSQGR